MKRNTDGFTVVELLFAIVSLMLSAGGVYLFYMIVMALHKYVSS